MRFLQALIAFLVLPGVVAFAIPAWWTWDATHWRQVWFPGFVLFAGGCIGLLWCVRDFYVAGKGTLAPWAPPRHLVTVGLYRLTRNPMYVCVTLILAGWAATFSSAE